MAEPTLLTQRSLIREVAVKWDEQYRHYPADNEKRSVVSPKLHELDKENATAEDVAAIIGNGSWTAIVCNGCDKYVIEAVMVGQKPDYESATATLCRECLTKAAALLPAESASRP